MDSQTAPGEPIVSGSGRPTEKLSQLMDHFIGTIVHFPNLHLRDLVT